MILLENIDRGCMRLGTNHKYGTQGHRKTEEIQSRVHRGSQENLQLKIYTKKQLLELLFENCVGCEKMAAIPQGAYAACKVRANRERGFLISPEEEKEKRGKESAYNPRPSLEGWELTPLKYNSKLMNSIWGLYNRYSVHNFKKITDADDGVSPVFATICGSVLGSCQPVATGVAASAATVDSFIFTEGNCV